MTITRFAFLATVMVAWRVLRSVDAKEGMIISHCTALRRHEKLTRVEPRPVSAWHGRTFARCSLSKCGSEWDGV